MTYTFYSSLVLGVTFPYNFSSISISLTSLEYSSSSSNIILLKHKDSLSSIQPLKQKEASPLKESVDIYGIKNEENPGFSLKDYIE